MAGILCWEAQKYLSPKKRKILYFNIISFCIILVAAKTRSLFFIIPYFLYQSYRYTNKFWFYTGVIICLVIGGIYLNSLFHNLRIKEDGSTITRSFLYKKILAGIYENDVVIPHGSNASNSLAKILTKNMGFSPHNDFLRYLYDWGVYFFVVLIYFVSMVKKRVKINLNMMCILLALASCALHNIMFLPAVWIPFSIILCLNKHDNRPTATCHRP